MSIRFSSRSQPTTAAQTEKLRRQKRRRLAIELLEDRSLLAAGAIDTSFGANGVSRIDLATNAEGAARVAVQTDGKLVTAGSGLASTGNWDFVVARFLVDGGLDTSFGTGGKVVIPFGSGDDFAESLFIQSDGKILVVGETYNGANNDVALVRLTDSGQFDNSFGTQGKVTTAFGSGHDNAREVAVSPLTGDIFVAGDTQQATQDMMILKYNASGILDSSFDGDGKLAINFVFGDVANSIAIQSNGSIAVSGFMYNGANFDFAMARVTSTGVPDSSFGSGGKMSFAIGSGADYANSMVMLPSSGSFVLAGFTTTGTKDNFAVARVTSNGQLDTTNFGASGKAVVSLGAGNDRAQAITLQPDGKLLVAGLSTAGTFLDMGVVRLTAAGQPDSLFDGDGKRTIAVTPQDDLAYSVALQGTEKAILLGQSSNGSKSATTLVRITLTDNTAPYSLGLASNSFRENQPVGTVVGVLTSSDADVGDTFTYSLVSGAGSTDNIGFQIVGNSLRTAHISNYNTQRDYLIRIRTTDNSGAFFEKVFSVATTPTFGTPRLLQSIASPNSTSSSTGANFGRAVAASGTYYVGTAPQVTVGSTVAAGQAFVFNSNSGGLIRTLDNPSVGSNDQMGFSAAITGDAVAFGAPGDRVGALTAGRAMLFNAATGVLIAAIDNPSPANLNGFGQSIAASNGLIAVGAPKNDVSATDTGSVYLYNSMGVLQRAFNNPSPTANTLFGTSVDVDSTRLSVGSSSASGGGKVYVFDVSVGTLLRTFSNPTGLSGDKFGDSIAISGNRLAIGAYGAATASSVRSGRVYVYDLSNGSLQRTIDPVSQQLDDQFGFRLDFESDFLVIGAPKTDSDGAGDVGAAYVYDAATGNLVGNLNNPLPSANDQFGSSIAVSEAKILVGSPLEDTKATDQGYVHVFSMAIPPFALNLSASSIPENVPIGTTIGSLSTSANISPVTYALIAGTGSSDNPSFQIVGNQLRTNSLLNFEVKAAYSILVEATDALGKKSQQVFAIAVTNVNEAPTALLLSNSRIAEDQPVGTLVGSLSTSDPDLADTFTYSLPTGAADNDKFTISGTQLRTNRRFDFETGDSYTVSIRSQDAGGLSITWAFLISIDDLNPPVITSQPRYDIRNVVDLKNTIQSSSPSSVVELGGITYFAGTSPTLGRELYRTDRTNSGTSIVKDLLIDGDANPQSITVFENRIYFLTNYSYVDPNAPGGDLPETRFGLWKTNGTATGTGLVKNIPFGMGVTPFRAMNITNGKLIFNVGDEIWSSNGTDVGTIKILDAPPSTVPTVPTLNTGSQLFLNLGISGFGDTHYLYRTDGTPAGTVLLRQGENGNPTTDTLDSNLVELNGNVYFVSTSTANGRELWKTNGTVAGTALLKDINTTAFPSESSSPFSLTVANGELFFTANDGVVGRELWKSNGTAAGTVLVKDIRVGTSFDSGFASSLPSDNPLIAWNNRLYFVANNGSQGLELWQSNGTGAGTQIVFDYGTTNTDALAPRKLIVLPNRLLIQTSQSSSVGSQLWATDGTGAGTIFLADPDGTGALGDFAADAFLVGGRLFFNANSPAQGNELWVSDGTAVGTQLVKEFQAGAASGLSGILASGTSGVYFHGDDSVVGNELGYSDGTPSGTFLLDVARGTPPSDVLEVVSTGSALFVATKQGLYKVDATNNSTVLLTSKEASKLTPSGSGVYFVVPNASSVNELWGSNGTVGGTSPVTTSIGETIKEPEKLTVSNGTLYYTAKTTANGRELWSGSALHFEFAPGAADGNIESIFSVGTKLYVVASGKLYVKGSASTYTYLVDAAASTLMPWENTLYFSGFSAANGYELWRTEGTILSTYMVSDIIPGSNSSYPGGGVIAQASAATAAGEAIEAKLVFRAMDANGVSQLFATNGTTAGTFALTNEPLVTLSNGSTASLTPVNLKSVDGRVYFEGFRQDVGRELWVSNGTAAGTSLVKDLRPGTAPSPLPGDLLFPSAYFNLKELTSYHGRIFFRTLSSGNGAELWTSDGSTPGTDIAVDAMPGSLSGNTSNLVVLGDRLYFSANTYEYGIGTTDTLTGELFRLNEAPYSIPVQQTTTQNVATAIKLRGIDRDGDPLNFEVVSQPQNGAVIVNGRIATFTPTNGYTGLDSFTYRAFDGSLYSDAVSVSVGVQVASTRQVSFAISSLTVAEQSTVYLATVNLSQAFTELTVLPYSIGYGGLQKAIAGEVVFSPGQTQAQFGVQLYENSIDQSIDQQIEVSLLANPYVALGSIPELLITLTDNDPAPEVFFIDYQRTFNETDGTIGFDVGLSRPSDRTITTEVTIGSFGATLGVDYSASPTTIVEFSPGQVRRRVIVKLLDDSTSEVRELVIAGIGTTTNATVTSDPNRFRSLVWIEDNDISVVNISPAVTLGVEGDSIVLQATRSGGNLTVPLTIPVTLTGNSTANSDYTLSSSSFQFSANATTASITVNLTVDGQVETFEDVTVELPVSASFNRGPTYQSYIGIYDQDRTTISLEFGSTNSVGVTAPVSISERLPGGAGNWRIDVIAKLSAPSSQTISVPVAVNSAALSGYATLGTDFLFSTANFVFEPGQTQVTRVLEIINDSLVEPDERLQISLAPTATQFDLRKNGIKNDEGLTRQLVIRNDDNTFSISAPERVSEGVGTFQFSINWDVPLTYSNSIYVNFSGSLGASEYSVAGLNNRLSNEIFFAPGEQSKTFTVTVIDDTVFESAEQLTISAVSTVGDANPRMVTVIDNDSPPTASFTSNQSSLPTIVENLYSIPIKIDRVSTLDIEVSVNFTGPAIKDTDFKVLGVGDKGIVKIPAGRNVGSLTVYLLPPVANGVFAKTGVLEFNVTITGGQNVSISNPKPSTNIRIIDGSKQLAAFLQAKYPVPSAQSTQDLAKVPAGTLAIEQGAAAGQSGNGSSTSGSPISVIQLSDAAIPGQLQIGGGQGGILDGSQVFFDANFNSVADYLDLNQNGRQDTDEPNEPLVSTNLGGSFAITIPDSFDRNKDGIINASEGRYVIFGGVDRSTNLPWSLQMAAPVGIYSITPLTTLIETLTRRQFLDYSTAADRVVKAFDLGSYDLRAGQSIYSVLARDPSASLAYSRQVMLNGLAITSASLIQGRSGNALQTHVDEAFDFLADTIARAGVKLDLTNVGMITQLLTAMNSRLSAPLASSSLNGAAQLITLGMSRLQSLRINDYADPQDYLRALTRIKKLLYTSVANDLQNVGAGTRTIDSVLATYTGSTAPNFDSLAAAQVVGIVIPPVLGVTNAAKTEGASGTQSMDFSVQLVGQHADAVTVKYQTVDTTANAASGDYTSVSGILNWPAGDNTPRIVQVPISGDSVFEPDEYFCLLLSDATNAVIQIQNGKGFILNDEVFASPTTGVSSNFIIYHGTELTEISQNNSTLTSGRFVSGLQATLTGSVSNPNAFEFNFSSNTYSDDRYTVVGGNSNDALALTAGRFQRIVHRVKDSANGSVMLDSESNTRVTLDWSSIESILADVSSVNQLVIHLPTEVTDAVIDDPDTTAPGQMRVRSLTNQFTPIVFAVPNTKLTIVRMNRAATVQTLGIDPSFTGVIEVLAGGIDLANASVAENLPSGTLVGSFTTQDPLLVGGFSVALVSGEGSTGNSSFVVIDKSLRTSAAFDYESQNSYSIRARSTDGLVFVSEHTFPVNVTNVNEAPTGILLGNNTIHENAAVNALVGLLSGSDPDAGDTLTFSLPTGVEDNASFNVSGSSLRGNASLNYEAKSSYSVTVRVTDAGGLFTERTFAITVVDLAELSQPVWIGDGSSQRSLIRQLVIEFDSDLIVDADAFLVQQRTLVSGSPIFTPVTTQFTLASTSGGGTQATLTFSGSMTNGFGALMDGNYQLTILGAKVRIRSSGLAFDGDLNGIPGGDYVLGAQAADNFFALFGDADGNGEVGTADVLRAQRAFAKHPGEANWNAAFDFDGNLEIGSADLLRVRRAFSKTRGSF